MIVYTFAWDDDNGTGCSVHSTERERDIAFIDHVAQADSEEHEKAMQILDSEDDNDNLWEYLQDNCFNTLATYGLDQDTVPDPTPSFTDRELATVLHALRHYQERHYGTAGECVEADEDGTVCSHFDDAKPLTAEEIDALCERLNLGPEKTGRSCACGHTWYKHTNQIGHVGAEDTWGCEDCNCTEFKPTR